MCDRVPEVPTRRRKCDGIATRDATPVDDRNLFFFCHAEVLTLHDQTYRRHGHSCYIQTLISGNSCPLHFGFRLSTAVDKVLMVSKSKGKLKGC